MPKPFGSHTQFATVAYLRGKWVLPEGTPLKVIKLRARHYLVVLSPRTYSVVPSARPYTAQLAPRIYSLTLRPRQYKVTP